MAQTFVPPDTPLFRELWASQQGLCALCGEPMPAHRFEAAHARIWAKRRPSFDHIRPLSKGGGDEPENLRLVHAACNKRRGNAWDGR